jgi:hypothetical protein
MTATIRIAHADGRVGELDLPFGSYDVGRDRGYIVLGDAHCSSVHARLHVHPAGVTVTDLGSANGTFDADGGRVTGPTSMQLDRPIRLGGSEVSLIRFLAPSGGTVLASGGSAPALAAQIPNHAAPALHARPAPSAGWVLAAPVGGAPGSKARRVGLLGVVALGAIAIVVIGALVSRLGPPSQDEAKAAFLKAMGGGAQVERMLGEFKLHECKSSDLGGYTCDFSVKGRALSGRFIKVDGEWKAILN